MVRALLLAAALVASGCSSAGAGVFYSGDFGVGGGGVVGAGASKVVVIDVDFTAESVRTLTAAADNLLDDGTTNLRGCSFAGTAEFDGAGLHLAHTGDNFGCLYLSSLASITDLGDDVARGPLIVTAQIDTVASFGTPATGNGMYLGWYTDGEGVTIGAGRVGSLSSVIYDGAAWDVDAFADDGSGSTSAAQAGNFADFPAYVSSVLYGTDSHTRWGDAAGFPASIDELSEGYTYTGAARALARTTALEFGNTATYEPSIVLGIRGGGDLTITRLRVEQIQ